MCLCLAKKETSIYAIIDEKKTQNKMKIKSNPSHIFILYSFAYKTIRFESIDKTHMDGLLEN